MEFSNTFENVLVQNVNVSLNHKYIRIKSEKSEKRCWVPGVTQAVLLVLGVAEGTLAAHSMRSGQ